MEDNPSVSVNEQNFKHGTANGIPIDDRSPRADAAPKLTPDTKMPCGHRMNGRNLIVCIDGTSNQFGAKNTNVIELYHLILKEFHDSNQRTWYNSGIGTYARPSWKSLTFYKKVLYHKIDLAIAWDFERTVLGAYRWLSDNYEKGDCLFLFGFSRGAFQVRVLSAMIDKVGLIYKGNEMQIPFAYELYADPESDKPKVGSQQKIGSQDKISAAERFKSAFSHKDVKVHFVGAWDTVSSIGIARGQQMLPGTIDGMTHVCYFRHALALDERRVKFLPEFAYGGTTEPPSKSKETTGKLEGSNVSTADHRSLAKENTPPSQNEDSRFLDDMLSHQNAEATDLLQERNLSIEKGAHTKEVWFAGTHSDIGGGNAENVGMDRSRPPLRWMVFEAGRVGLRTAQFERELSPEEQIEIQESLTWHWWLLELIPLKRLTFTRRKDGEHTTHKPHLGSSRKIHPGQKIHSSLLLADKSRAKYTPKARPLDNENSFWEELGSKKGSHWLEVDLYEDAQNVIESFITKGHPLEALRQMVKSGDGRQAVYENVIEALRRQREIELRTEVKHQLLSSAMDILGKSCPHLRLRNSIEIRPFVSDLWMSGDKGYQKTVQEFMGRFTDSCLLVLRGHTNWVTSVAFSPDAKCIVSGSYDRSILIWDAKTGNPVGEPLRGHTDEVRSVAFSNDGKRIVSSSTDKTVRLWDAKTGTAVGGPLRGHTDAVRSVGFSSDGKRIVSGSSDKTIRIWDAATGNSVGEPLRGHTGYVRSVAFSPDGKRIVSGSDDKTIRTWDVETRNQVGEPFQGHTYWVRSVAFSSDGKRIVSGSDDETVRIWDAETGCPVGEPLRGHTGTVWSVAFSPDGKRIVSSSSDGTVWIWDAEKGNPVGEPLRGHRDRVWSVALSPDGKRIVSGSHDKTVQVWDAEHF